MLGLPYLRLPEWLRQANMREALRLAHAADACVANGTAPEHVRGYALRLRLWAADVANGLRP